MTKLADSALRRDSPNLAKGKEMSMRFFGFVLFDGDTSQFADEILEVLDRDTRESLILACLNPHSFMVAKRDKIFHGALLCANWLIPDGIGVVWGARRIGVPIKCRVTGPDVFTAVMERLDKKGGSVFFLGSTQKTLDKIRNRMAENYPNVTVAGLYSPPFKAAFSEDDNSAMIDAVNQARPDLLWVGMTAPKQEKWLAEHREQLDIKAAGAIGATFDFFAGNTKRSPMIMQRLGLEWLHRSIMSPSRLGKRNISSNPKFVLEVFREKLGYRNHTS